MVVPSLVLAGLLAAVPAQSATPKQVYGFAQRVIIEPNVERPERLQVWGLFSVAVPAAPGEYQVPEQGYLYFQLPADAQDARSEWLEMKRAVDAGTPVVNRVGTTIKGILSFGRPGGKIRVRKSDEAPSDPDVYNSGNGVTVVSYNEGSRAVEMLGRTPKPQHHFNYALIDRVVFEPNAEHAEQVQIWGVFILGKPDGSFTAPQRGYVYFRPRNRGPNANDWRAIVGTRQVAGFYLMDYEGWRDLRVRPSEEKPLPPMLWCRWPRAIRPDPTRNIGRFDLCWNSTTTPW